MLFSPPASTRMVAEPVGSSASIPTSVVSMPSAAMPSRAAVPKASDPTRPTIAT